MSPVCCVSWQHSMMMMVDNHDNGSEIFMNGQSVSITMGGNIQAYGQSVPVTVGDNIQAYTTITYLTPPLLNEQSQISLLIDKIIAHIKQ